MDRGIQVCSLGMAQGILADGWRFRKTEQMILLLFLSTKDEGWMDYNLWFMIVFDCVWLFLNDCVWLCMIVLWSYQLYAYKDMDWRSWPRMMSQQEFRHGSSSAYAKPMLPYLQGWTINCPIIVMWKPGGSIVPWVLTRTQPVAPLAPQAAQQTMQYVVLYLIPTLVEALAVLRWYGAWRSISLHHEGIWLGDFGSPSNEVRKKNS